MVGSHLNGQGWVWLHDLNSTLHHEKLHSCVMLLLIVEANSVSGVTVAMY